MRAKPIWIAAFVLVALGQLYMLTSTIWKMEDTITTGNLYKFRVEPVDPTDLFRGKYVRLNFKDDEFITTNYDRYDPSNEVYLSLKEDEDGYAVVDTAYLPGEDIPVDHLRINVGHIWSVKDKEDLWRVTLTYHFNRFYMEESKAPAAEEAYNNAVRNGTSDSYALVAIKNGEAVLLNVYLRGLPLVDIAEEQLLLHAE